MPRISMQTEILYIKISEKGFFNVKKEPEGNISTA